MARFSHKRLARRPGLWRVDGIGLIEPHGKLGTRTTIHFSGLSEDGVTQPYWKSSLNGLTFALRVHSASLREFKVGSLWRDGKRVAGPPGIRDTFEIDPSRARVLSLDERAKLGDQWVPTVLPSSYFHMGENRARLQSSLYVLVPVLNDVKTSWLVAPASEILRFYFGVSARLLSGSLQGNLGRYVDWNRSRVEDGRPVVHVKQRVNKREASVIARAVYSSAWRTALMSSHQHLAMSQANNVRIDESRRLPLTIKSGFPFVSPTRLSVAGKRMPMATNGANTQWGVLAMEILDCSHAYGFSSLVLESDDPFGDENVGGEGNEGAQPPRHTPLLEDEDEFDLDDVQADQRLGRLIVHSYTNQFSALISLEIEHRRPVSNRRAHRAGPEIDVPVGEFTLGDGTYAADAHGNLGISDFDNHVAQVDRDLSLFIEMLGHLRQSVRRRGWKIATRRLNDGLFQDGESIAVFPDKLGKRRSWHKIVDASGNTRTRQVVWAEIAINDENEFAYLMEMELKHGESGQCTILLHLSDFSRLEDRQFSELLVLTAVQNRWPDHHNKWPSEEYQRRANAMFAKVKMHRIHHPKRTDDERKTGAKNAKLNPVLWSAVLVDRMDELLPSATA